VGHHEQSCHILDWVLCRFNAFLDRHASAAGLFTIAAALHVNESGALSGFDDLMRDTLIAGRTVKVEVQDGYWLDIGRPDDYARAIDDFESGREKFPLS
jgi:NDP-sugar pyrophosphorylase family protein